MKQLLLLIVAFCICFNANSQTDYVKGIDSLQTALVKSKPDTSRVSILNGLAKSYTLSNKPDMGIEYGRKALGLSEEIKWTLGVAKSLENLAVSYEYKSDGVKEREYYFKALDAAKKAGNKSYIAHLYGMLAINHSDEDITLSIKCFNISLNMYRDQGKMDKYYDILVQMGGMYKSNGNLYRAGDCFAENLKYAEKIKDTGRMVNGMMYLAEIYTTQENYNKALSYYNKASELAANKKDQFFFEASVLKKKGDIYFIQKKYKEAIRCYTKSGGLFDKVGSVEDKVSNRFMLSLVYNAMKDTQKAKEYLEAASILNETNPYETGKMHGYVLLGRAAFAAADYENALLYHSKALARAQELKLFQETAVANGSVGATLLMLAKSRPEKSSLLDKSIDHLNVSIEMFSKINRYSDLDLFYDYLSQAYQLNNKHHEALLAYKNHIKYRDSVFNKTKRDEFNAKQMDYEYGKKEALLKERQIAEMESEKTMRNISFAGVGILFVIAGGAGVAYRRKKRDNTIIAKEKKRSDELLLNILPAEVAEELKEKGEAAAHYYEHVSILFTDFEGFTRISSKMSPQEVIAELNYCFKAFDNIITKYNIEKIKTIGDSYMAVSGLPGASPDHAVNVVRAAIEIRDFILDYKEQRKREGKIYFEMRIGINSGEVVAGIVGIKKFAYDIWGDAVNIAARMESNGIVGKINISESTYELVKDEFNAEYRGEIEAKGKGKVRMYFVEPKKY